MLVTSYTKYELSNLKGSFVHCPSKSERSLCAFPLSVKNSKEKD